MLQTLCSSIRRALAAMRLKECRPSSAFAIKACCLLDMLKKESAKSSWALSRKATCGEFGRQSARPYSTKGLAVVLKRKTQMSGLNVANFAPKRKKEKRRFVSRVILATT